MALPVYQTEIGIEGKNYVFQHTDHMQDVKMRQPDGTFQTYKPFWLVGRLLTRTKLIGLLNRHNAKKVQKLK